MFRRTLQATTVIAATGLMAFTLGLSTAPGTAQAREEGMWTFDNFPLARVNQIYGVYDSNTLKYYYPTR